MSFNAEPQWLLIGSSFLSGLVWCVRVVLLDLGDMW